MSKTQNIQEPGDAFAPSSFLSRMYSRLNQCFCLTKAGQGSTILRVLVESSVTVVGTRGKKETERKQSKAEEENDIYAFTRKQ